MKIHAMGDGPKLAKSVHYALALSKTPLIAPAAETQKSDIGFGTNQVYEVMRQSRKLNGVVFQYSIVRADGVWDSLMNVEGQSQFTGDVVLVDIVDGVPQGKSLDLAEAAAAIFA